MTASRQHTAVSTDKSINDISHRNLPHIEPLPNGKISPIPNTKTKHTSYEMEQTVNNTSTKYLNRESSMSLLIPTINGDISTSAYYSNKHYERKDAFIVNKERFTLNGYKDKYMKTPKKHRDYIFWRQICPFSISDRFEKTEINGNKKMIGYLYALIITPDSVNTKFAILTPKRISKLELKHIKFRIHYPEFKGCTINAQNMIQYSKVSSNVAFKELKKYEFNDNEWQLALEFNKILFQILYPKLSHWVYRMKEIQSIELRNYLILPVLDDIIDWNLIHDIVKYHYNTSNESYHIKQFLIDLGLIENNKDDEINKKTKNFEDIVLFQNGSYFVPFDESKQREIGSIKRIIEEQKDLNEMKELLEEDIDDIYSLKDNEDNNEFYDEIIHKIGTRLQLLSLRFDKMNDFITNITDSASLIYRKSKNMNKRIYKPRIDIIDIGRYGVFKAPFDSDFLYGTLKIPFILFEFERIFRIFQFVESEQYLMKISERKMNKKSILMKIPLLTLSKIMFRESISVPFNDLFKSIGSSIATLIYSTSSILSILNGNNENMVNITQTLMNDSVCMFRNKLKSNHIFDYLSLDSFRGNDWTPSRFCNNNNNKNNNKKKVNKYISLLLYPITTDKECIVISNKYLFAISIDIFSSIWYYNFGKIHNNLSYLNCLFSDCNDIVLWMNMNDVLNIKRSNIIDDLNEATKVLNVSNNYSLFDLMIKEEKESSALKGMNVSIQSILCDVIRDISYSFIYPPIVMTMIDPFCELKSECNDEYNQHRIHNKLSFQLLYDLGNIVLNTIITLSVATHCYSLSQYNECILMFYRKCLTSNKYLSHYCKYHRLNKHIIHKNKEKHNELMPSFVFAVVGAIYLDSNLTQNNDNRI